MAARLEVAGARGETVQYRAMVERAETATRIEQAQLAPMRAAFTALERDLGSMQAELATLRGSLSWRLTAPLRQLLWRLTLLRARLRRRPAAQPVPTPSPADPNERYLFKPGEAATDRGETVTVERLYELSRAP